MVGELYKSGMGWMVKYPINRNADLFDLTLIPVTDSSKFSEKDLGKIVPFSIVLKKDKKFNGEYPQAKIEI